jgi:hypothetical protein
MPNYNEMKTKKGGHADHLSSIKKEFIPLQALTVLRLIRS